MKNEIRFYGREYPSHKEFSNFWPAKLNIDGKEWDTVEHYYQAMKSLNLDIQEDVRLGYPLGMTAFLKEGAVKLSEIVPNKTAEYSKKQGRRITYRDDWDAVKEDVMRKALQAKFSDVELRKKLLDTGDAIIIEASPSDFYWGEGEPKIGQNRLGVLLMELRDNLLADSSS
jgi:hypothetical protein